MPEETRYREATGTRPSEGRTTLERPLGAISTGGSDVKGAWGAPEKEVQRLSTLKLTQTKTSKWTHCSAMIYSPGRGVQGTPATCT